MTDEYGSIREGMDVVDLAGDRIGSVAAVVGERPPAHATQDPSPVGRNMEARRAGQGASGYIEVDRPGGPLYIPFSVVNRVLDDAVELSVDREAMDTLTWGRPPNLD